MALSFEQIRDAIRAALAAMSCSCAGTGVSYCNHPHPCPCCTAEGCSCFSCASIHATFEDGVIVSLRGGQLRRYPVTFGKDGKAALGAPEPVEIIYQTLKEAVGGRLLGPIVEEGANAKPGSKWLVCVIQEGLSANRTLYPAAVLQESAHLYEGAKVFWNHALAAPGVTPMRDPRDIAGYLSAPKFVAKAEEASGGKATGLIIATLHATTKEARERLLEAFDGGNPGLYGLSHTAAAEYQIERLADGPARRVKRIVAVESVDVVSFPSAGGRVMRLVAGLSSPIDSSDKEFHAMTEMLRRLQESAPDLFKLLSASPTESEVGALIKVMEARTVTAPPPAANPGGSPSATAGAPAGSPQSASPATSSAEVITIQEARELRSLAHTMRVDQALAGRTMPDKLKATLRESLLGRVGMAAEAITAEVNRFVEASAVTTAPAPAGTGLARTTEAVEISGDEADKFAESLDGLFMEGASEAARAEYKNAFGKDAPRRGPRSLKRDIYERATGDADVIGYVSEGKARTHYTRLMEGCRARFTEAIGTSTLSNAFASSMNRRLLAEYRASNYAQRWRRVVSTVKPLTDFRNQELVRMGHLGDLPIVSQGGTYTEFSDPTDEKVSYAASKRGAIISITREAIKNDDIGVIRRIPQLIALSAARTLFKFVFDFITTNPTLDDSVALFAAATTRGTTSNGNLQTAALSETTIGVARQRLLKVKDKDDETNLGLSPKILIVPPELEKDAIRFTTIPMIPVSGQNATEPNYVAQKYGLNEYIVLEHLTDANNYFIVADPAIIDTIEIGFVDGQEEPVILVQDQETVGSVFTADKWSYKGRHEYGGDVAEWRGFQGGIVA